MKFCLQCLLNTDSGASSVSPSRHLDTSSLQGSLPAFQVLWCPSWKHQTQPATQYILRCSTALLGTKIS